MTNKYVSIVYECAKEGVTIDLPVGVVAFSFLMANPLTLPVIAQAALVSAGGYTLSCSLGRAAGEYFESSYAVIAGRTVGNAIKYASVSSILGGAITTTTVLKGGLNGALYGISSTNLQQNLDIFASIPIEVTDSLFGGLSFNSLKAGSIVGSSLVGAIYFHISFASEAIDSAMNNTQSVIDSFINTISGEVSEDKGEL